MNLLALDTSTDACSVALALGEHIDERHVVAPREHTRLLIPAIEELLKANKTTLDELDAIVLGNGPGSFIGMRIGASVAQGIAFGLGIEIVPVSSLAAIAADVLDRCEVQGVVVTQDARMNEVYLAEYARDANGSPRELSAVRLHKVGDPIPVAGRKLATAGAGWRRYPALTIAGDVDSISMPEALYPRARYLFTIGRGRHASGAGVRPDEIEPFYVRMRVAAVPGDGQSTAE